MVRRAGMCLVVWAVGSPGSDKPIAIRVVRKNAAAAVLKRTKVMVSSPFCSILLQPLPSE